MTESGKKGRSRERLDGDARYIIQRNYFIMKLLWQLRPKPVNMQDFYRCVGIARNRYSALVRYVLEVNVQLKGVAQNLHEASGAALGVFLGEIPLEVKGFTDEMWEQFFKDMLDIVGSTSRERSEDIGKQKKVKRRVSDTTNQIKEQLSKIPATPDGDKNLYKLYCFLVRGIKDDGEPLALSISHVKQLFQRMPFDDLARLKLETLSGYYEALREHTETVGIILKYKTLQGEKNSENFSG